MLETRSPNIRPEGMVPKIPVATAEMKNWTTPTMRGMLFLVLPASRATTHIVGPAIVPNVAKRKISRVERWEALCQVVGTRVNSQRVAMIMISVATAPPSAVADQIMAGVGSVPSYFLYITWEL